MGSCVCFLHIQLIRTYVRLPKIHKIPPEVDFWILKIPQQSLSLGTIPIENAAPNYPHDNVVGSHLCDECMKSNGPSVRHMLLSIQWLIEQVCWPTTECLVFQFVPRASMSRQFANFWQFSTDSSSSCLNAWIDDRPNKDAKLCIVAPSFCLPIRSTDLHIFEDVIPCRGSTMKFLRRVCPILAIAQLLQQIYLTHINFFVNCSISVSFGLHSRWMHPKYTWARSVRGSYSARVPRSSFARVRRVLVFHIMEEEAEDQENEQDDRREDGQQRVEGRVDENQNNHIMRMKMGWSEMCAARQTWPNVDVTLICVLAGARKCDVWGVLFAHTVGCSRFPSAVNDLDYNKKILWKCHSEQLSDKAASTSRPVLWCRSFHELRGIWLWWIYQLHQWSFHCHHDVLDEEEDECHFRYW